MKNPVPRLASEFVGTFALVFAGVGAFMSGKLLGQDDLLVVALAHGLAIAVMVTALAHISGAHFNPAVSFAMYVSQRMTLADFAAYVAAQLFGATAAALILNVAFDSAITNSTNVGTPTLIDGLSTGMGLILEIIMTFMLVLVVFTVAVDRKGAFASVAGLPIGLIITMNIFVGGPLTGAALNPARWFGPAVVSGTWTHWSVWIIGPLLGGTLAVVFFDRVLTVKRKTRRKKAATAR